MFDGGLHDITEADLQDDGSYVFRGVIEPSPWQRFDFVLSKEQAESDAFKEQLFKAIESLGGTWETMFGGLVCLYLPQGIQFNLQEQIVAITKDLRSDPQKVEHRKSPFHGERRSMTYDLSREVSPKKNRCQEPFRGAWRVGSLSYAPCMGLHLTGLRPKSRHPFPKIPPYPSRGQTQRRDVRCAYRAVQRDGRLWFS